MRKVLGMTGNRAMVQDTKTDEVKSLNLVVNDDNQLELITDEEFKERLAAEDQKDLDPGGTPG